jgi:hypothetical protein
MDGLGDILNDNAKLKQSLSNNVIENDPFAIEDIANHLAEKLKAPDSFPFYCKAAQYLTRKELDTHLETALLKGKHPAMLFNYIVSRRLLKLGVEIKLHAK